MTSSLPDVLFDPDHAPDAEQDVALDEDQVRVKASPAGTLEDELLSVTEGAGVVLPPSPPPPHAVSPPRRNAPVTTRTVPVMNRFIHASKRRRLSESLTTDFGQTSA